MNRNPSHRRKFKRFKIKGSAIVMIHKPRIINIGKPKLVELGPLVDISLGGLAVQYIERKDRGLEGDRISISVPENGLGLEGVCFRVVSDRVLATMPDGRKIHNCCIEFRQLSAYQSFQLENFIKSHTQRNAGDRRSSLERRRFDDPRFQDEDYRRTFDRRGGQERRSNWPPT